MDGLCDFCGKAFEEDEAVVHISSSTWDANDGRMRDDWEREDSIVHEVDCLKKIVLY